MIIYSAVKRQFREDVALNRIPDLIRTNLKARGLPGGAAAEYRSWQNSLHFMSGVLDDAGIPEDAPTAIEYQIP